MKVVWDFYVMNHFLSLKVIWTNAKDMPFLTSKTEIFVRTFTLLLAFPHFKQRSRMTQDIYIPIPVSSHFLFSKDQKLGKTVWRRVAHTCVTRVTAIDTAVLPAVRTRLIVLLETLASAVPVQTFLSTWQSIRKPSLHTGCN